MRKKIITNGLMVASALVLFSGCASQLQVSQPKNETETVRNVGSEIYEIAKKKRELLAIIMIDIDNFQTINESYGHEIGDEVIVLLANCLLDFLNKDSIIARIGQDQFCIMLQNRPYAEIYQIFEEFKDKVKEEFIQIATGKITFTISIGATINKNTTLINMMDDADEALANASHKGGDMVIINS